VRRRCNRNQKERHSQRHLASRSAGRAADQVRAGHQRANRAIIRSYLVTLWALLFVSCGPTDPHSSTATRVRQRARLNRLLQPPQDRTASRVEWPALTATASQARRICSNEAGLLDAVAFIIGGQQEGAIPQGFETHWRRTVHGREIKYQSIGPYVGFGQANDQHRDSGYVRIGVTITSPTKCVFKTVASLNRPGGNVTEIAWLALKLEAKRLGLLHELLPQAMR
jgi:hypothetical protein